MTEFDIILMSKCDRMLLDDNIKREKQLLFMEGQVLINLSLNASFQQFLLSFLSNLHFTFYHPRHPIPLFHQKPEINQPSPLDRYIILVQKAAVTTFPQNNIRTDSPEAIASSSLIASCPPVEPVARAPSRRYVGRAAWNPRYADDCGNKFRGHPQWRYRQ